MIINGAALLAAEPIKDMIACKRSVNGVSHGLTECGYDIRLKQGIHYRPCPSGTGPGIISIYDENDEFVDHVRDRFVLGSSVEEFQMPANLMGRILNKSTWARQGVDASLTTNIEPGWNGFLTIELVFNRAKEVIIPPGAGICQIIFETLAEAVVYSGKYQNQEDKPVEAIFERRVAKPISSDEGPVCIVDAKGVHPERLDNAVLSQRMYGRRSTMDQFDPTKRGLTPK